jgi:hypothetical protein
VIVFDVYSTLASYAVGMFMCLTMPAAPTALVSKHWVLDVRMQCPTQRLDKWWGACALVLGVVLLVLCILYPVGIAAVLIWRACHNTLDPNRSDAPSHDEGGSWHIIFSSLAFRFLDYDVQYESWGKRAPGGKSQHRSWASAFKQWASQILHKSQSADPVWGFLKRLRMLLVLTWDSILDFQRLVLAVLGLSVMLHELHQILLVTLALGMYLMLMLAVRPWRLATIYWLQVLATSVLVLSCCGIMACNVAADGHYSQEDVKLYKDAVSWAVITINLAYIGIGFGALSFYCWRDFRKWRFFRGWKLANVAKAVAGWGKAHIGVSKLRA